jgi:alkaline phosphatase
VNYPQQTCNNTFQKWHTIVTRLLLASLRFMTTISQRRKLMLNRMRRFRVAVSLVVITQFILTLSGCSSSSSDTATTPASSLTAKNVILIIGDGMQLEHERAASNYLFGTPDSGLEHQALPYKGVASTWDVNTYNRYTFGKYSSNGFAAKKYNDSTVDLNNSATFTATLGYDPSIGGTQPYRTDATTAKTYIPYFSAKIKDSATGSAAVPATDSASAATALAAGFKTDSGNIAWRTGDPANGRLTTIAEMYRNQKKASIGVVSTVPFSHATPAAFVSHNVNRGDYKGIAQEIITDVRPDVVIGGGHPDFNSATKGDYSYIGAPEYSNLKNSTEYTFAERKTGVDGGTALLAAADTAAVGGKKLFGLFGGVGGNFEYHKPSNDGTAAVTRGSIENPTLADASTAALKVLSKNTNGFFLMVEQGDIDWANHANSYNDMIGSMWDLNNAVKTVTAYIDNNTNNVTWDNTLVIVTSDHGNSFMRLQKDLAKGALPTLPDPTAVTYGTTEHTNELVTLYAKGAGSTRFSDYEGTWYPGTRIVDNTHIYKVMMSFLGLTDENRSGGTQPAFTFLYTSDAHYGIKRTSSFIFDGYSNAQQVNAKMVSAMNTMPGTVLPSDNGVNAGNPVKVNFVIQTGDIANRSQDDIASTGYAGFIQSSYDSWKQFETDYINGLQYPLYLVPGNHDVSNAIGYTKPLPATDGSILAFIYNMFVKPGTFDTSSKAAAQASYTNATYQDVTKKVFYSRDIAGVHFMFINMWPDTAAQTWMDNDLAKVDPNTPAIIFTHDQPETEGKHLTDPKGATVFTNKYENLLLNPGIFAKPVGDATDTVNAEQTFTTFLAKHKNIVAYFHGNDNYNQMNTCDPISGADTSPTQLPSTGRGCYKGQDNSVLLPEFRVDSPMKGAYSGLGYSSGTGSADPNVLSYQVISVDPTKKLLTVREYFWRAKKWGASATISLAARSK